MTMNYIPPPGPVPAPPMTQPPYPSGGSKNRLGRLAVAGSVVAAAAALVLSAIAVTREAPAPHANAVASSGQAPADSAEQAAGKENACVSWKAAARAMVAARQPFLDATQIDDGWSWNDPAVQGTLAQAQAGILTQVEYLRAQLTEKTPAEVAAPIREYITLNIVIIALDGQHERADVVNATAKRSNAVRDQIESICGRS